MPSIQVQCDRHRDSSGTFGEARFPSGGILGNLDSPISELEAQLQLPRDMINHGTSTRTHECYVLLFVLRPFETP
jgi:hypothetical protein